MTLLRGREGDDRSGSQVRKNLIERAVRGNDRSGQVHRKGQEVRSGQTESDRRAVRGNDRSGQVHR